MLESITGEKTLVPKLENSLRDLSTGSKIDFSSNRISTTVFIHPFIQTTLSTVSLQLKATRKTEHKWINTVQLKTTHKTQHNITQINFLERTHIPRRSCFTTAKTWSQTSQTMWASRAPTASAGINLFWEGKYRVAEVPAKLKVHFWRIHKCKVWSPCEAEPPSPLCGGCPGPPTLPAWAAWWVLALFTIHPPHCVHWSAFVFGEGPRCRTNQMISAKGEHLLAPNVRTKTLQECRTALTSQYKILFGLFVFLPTVTPPHPTSFTQSSEIYQIFYCGTSPSWLLGLLLSCTSWKCQERNSKIAPIAPLKAISGLGFGYITECTFSKSNAVLIIIESSG